MTRRTTLAALAAVLPTVLGVSAAWAYFTTTGTGSGWASVGALAAPGGVAGSPHGTDVAVTWAGVPAPGGGAVGYVVARAPVPSGPSVDVCGSPAAPLPAAPTSCTNSPVHAGTYSYVVTALYRTWTSTSAPTGPVVVDPVVSTTSLELSADTATYGAEDSVTFRATVGPTAGITPTGTVSVAADGVGLCSIRLPDTTCTADATALGSSDAPHTVTAAYGGDDEYTGSVSSGRDLTVLPDATTTAVAAEPDTVTAGYEDSAALTATVTTGNGEPLPGPNEDVTVDVGTTSCVAILVPVAGGGRGSCSIGPSALDVRAVPYGVTTAYPGDGDLSGSSATAATGLTVAATPTIATASLADATRTQTGYLQSLSAAGGSPPLAWSLAGGTLPTGLALDPATGEISGSVDPSATTETFRVRALDASGAAAEATLTLTVDDPPVVTTDALAPATAAEAGYSQTVTAVGGAPDLSWSVGAGVLPDGLTLDAATGVISGNLSSSATTETFAVLVTDANGVWGMRELTITVTRAFVQQRALPKASGTSSSFTVVLLSPVAPGDTLVLSLAQPCTTATGSPVASPVASATWDGTGFTRAVATGCSADGDAEIWYLVGAGSATGTNATTVTVTLAAAASVPFLDVAEYTGVTASDPAPGASPRASGVGASVSPGSVAPSVAGELVITTAFVAPSTPSSLPTQMVPFVLLNQTSPYQGFGAYLVDPTTSPVTYTCTPTAPGAWSAVATAFAMAS
ncbi:MAG TPA: putative Ig domain-containing protein [Acidimicrobiales bacterium]|nr:putative Ig domain-containing protein [Acidimicrobiales bacterium]